MTNTPPFAADPATEQSEPTVAPASVPELNLLLDWPDESRSSRWRKSFAISVAIHVILFGLSYRLESLIPANRKPALVRLRVAKLYLPPDLLTQREKNQGKLSKNFDLSALLQSQQAQKKMTAPPAGSVRRIEIPKSAPKMPKPESPQISSEAPKEPVIAESKVPAGVPDAVLAPQPPPETPPAVPLPSLGSTPQPGAAPKIPPPPKSSLSDVIRSLAHDSSTHLQISDEGGKTAPSLPGQQPLQGQMKSAIELQTDPQGADFKPYLARILSIVRNNWFTVLPQSARLGTLRGRTIVQFVVERNGDIPKLVIADSSGLQPLDRAAVAGLSMSNPLPPLPADFKGASIRLQFSFNYNVNF